MRTTRTRNKAKRHPFRPTPAVGPSSNSALTWMIQQAMEVK